VRVLELEPVIPSRRIALAWHRDRHRSPATRAFTELAREVCAEVESSLAPIAAA
jgi:DNA-binding transcriptional LysR family regulator